MTVKITRTTSPGESADQASGGSPARHSGTGPANFLDYECIDARNRTYANSTQEKAYIAATDRAAFARVQVLEQRLIANAEETVALSRAVNAEADSISEALFGLATKVQRGDISPDAAAVEYERLRLHAEAMRHRIARTLRAVESDERKVSDPYAHAQRVISLMPHASVQPLNAAAFM